VQYFGFSATPIFGAVIAAVGKRNRTMIPFLPFLVNEFSLPAIFVGCIAASNAALLYSLYSEKTRSNIYEEVSSAGDLNDSKNESSGLSDGRSAVVADEGHVSAGMEVPLHSHFNAVAATRIVVGGCLMNVAMKGTIGVFETLSSEFVTVMYHWDSLRTGYTFALFGALGVLCLLSFPLLQQFKVQDINLITTGSILMTSSCLILFAGSHR
jgi:Na+/melibiose symporter-like transporter